MAQLGKLTVITAYDAGNSEFPILGILCDPRAPGYTVPADLDPHPDNITWPNHVFESSIPAQNDGRVQHLYSIFPGPYSTSTRQDYDGETLTTKTRRNIAANVTTQETLVSTLWTRTFRQQQNNDLICVETQEFRTVAGNYVPTTKDNLLYGAIAGTRRLVANSALTTLKTATYNRTYDAHENSDLVVWELIETNSDGSGSAGNPAYPIRIEDSFEPDRGAIEKRMQVVIATGSEAGSLDVGSTLQTLLINNAGSGYVAGEVITLAGGTITTAAKVRVLTVSSGAIATFTIDERGLYTATSGSLTQGSTSGSGTGAIFNTATYAIQARLIAYQPIDQFKLDRSVEMWTLPGPSRVRAEVDGETGTEVLVTLQMIATPNLPFSLVAGSEIAYQPISSVHGTKITTTLSDFAALSVVDYPTGKMTAPALITGAVADLKTSRDGTPSISIVWTKRAAKTREVKMTRTKSYNTKANRLAAQTSLTLENPGVIDIIRDPLFFPAIREMNVLTNDVTLGPYTTGTENPKWPYMTETVSWTATVPTASDYPGRPVVLSAEVEKWKYNLWRLTKIEATTF